MLDLFHIMWYHYRRKQEKGLRKEGLKMKKIQLEINGAQGYGAEQVRSITVGELRAMLEDYEDNIEIVTHDYTNRYGASYGTIIEIADVEKDEDYE